MTRALRPSIAPDIVGFDRAECSRATAKQVATETINSWLRASRDYHVMPDRPPVPCRPSRYAPPQPRASRRPLANAPRPKVRYCGMAVAASPGATIFQPPSTGTYAMHRQPLDPGTGQRHRMTLAGGAMERRRAAECGRCRGGGLCRRRPYQGSNGRGADGIPSFDRANPARPRALTADNPPTPPAARSSPPRPRAATKSGRLYLKLANAWHHHARAGGQSSCCASSG